MTARLLNPSSTSVEPAIVISASGGARRVREPVTIGIPFPKAWHPGPDSLLLVSEDDEPIPFQAKVLDRWTGGSVRWLLLDFNATVPPTGTATYRLKRTSDPVNPHPTAASVLRVQTTPDGATVETGVARFLIDKAGRLRCEPDGRETITTELAITGADDAPFSMVVHRIACEEQGSLRAVVLVEGDARSATGGSRLHFFARCHFHAGTASLRVMLTIRNPRRARHPRGYWELGDPGSVFIRSASFGIALPRGEAPWMPICSTEAGAAFDQFAAPFEVYQGSSGGENWNSPNHLNRHGKLPLRFRGYRLKSAAGERSGLRATPVVGMQRARSEPAASDVSDHVAVTLRHFWQRFPKAIRAADGALMLDLLPRQSMDVHEIQGGEQLTEEFTVSFARDGITETPLQWARDPVNARLDPGWYCHAEAMPYLTPASEDPNTSYLALVAAAVDGSDTFATKRERIDEYGWRNFGEIYADHEAVGHSASSLVVSHYNNQYDVISGSACQFFRSGDCRWLTLMDELARHVIDIDIYHTDEDEAAYNHGLFWHTNHHTDAGLSTHRTYPSGAPGSGGPSAEHNYNTGLMLYYFLTGDARARDAAVGLAQWVIDMDDGAKSPFRWLSRCRTGLASATGSMDYHGPGRASGNSIAVLLNAFRLTHEKRFLEKAEELIRRCAHPAQDIDRLNLPDKERRWFYTIFLQALGSYLDAKAEHGDCDEMYAYGRAVLLEYAGWMAAHEYPALDRPELLAHPTETWAAQEMRKSDVFKYAARHARGDERQKFLERSRFFFENSVSTVSRFETRALTRPVVVLLTNGYMQACFDVCPWQSGPSPRAAVSDFGAPTSFVPQKRVVLRRLMAGAALALTGLWALLAETVFK